MYLFRHALLENGAVLMESSASHSTSFAMVKPIATMAVMNTVNFHIVSPCQQSSPAEIKVNVWLLSIFVTTFPIVMMGVTRDQMSANPVLLNLGDCCVRVVINVSRMQISVTIYPTVKMEAMSYCVLRQKAVKPSQESSIAKMAMDVCGKTKSAMV